MYPEIAVEKSRQLSDDILLEDPTSPHLIFLTMQTHCAPDSGA